jgi:Rrf2 family nitric oxide-sensitive transcriptional repressor
MQLSKFTDYSFRVLIFLAQNDANLQTVENLAQEFSASEHHIKKVVYKLAKLGFISTLKGRNGGLKLKLRPEDINLGNVILKMEENMNIVECFNPTNTPCPFLAKKCKLKSIVHIATNAFLSEFSKKTLADVL